MPKENTPPASPLQVRIFRPGPALSVFVDSCWMLQNPSDRPVDIVVLPDGRLDLFLSESAGAGFQIVLKGFETTFQCRQAAPRSALFAVSFKPLAAEYILRTPVADLTDNGRLLPPDFWGFHAGDLADFDRFCQKAVQRVEALLPAAVDGRKQQLFDLVYASAGGMTVRELSERVFWSSRQINRYFNSQYGLSLKAWCNILRFRASLDHLARGALFPELSYADQAHFIREVKRYSGAVPKELSRNPDGRFILLSTLKRT